MTSIVYSPADSRGWGFGNSSMRDYYLIGGALEPSDIYTVRVREHWRRKQRRKSAAVQATPVVVAPVRRPRRRRAVGVQVPSTRVLRSATRRLAPVVPALPAPAVVPALPAPVAPVAAAIPTVSAPVKRRRIG
ncbi:core protein precursor pVII [unidentified adenovirus]|uniref:Core protein pVII n=1 Tax=Chinstrap penguin adenovirus 2 TaxID=1434088 RepID=A0A162HSH3_9ADEN|nr:core protein precursor pVII [Chinstrap penguin adenovirus 2]ALB78143.1 core protein precursor pVII [Chinstrap penguin adenovirus 2]ALB78165.1 core protein precursor pVII [unidentified adenovirus]ALB78187.1 core protein precursor pVII [unidentified adenovirus]ALB78209.1 core protein precursor pVII [unidentified adenovirus]